ncbi:MAG TPA: acyltransferase [Solirubrobacteraceae bacterium]
MGRPVERTPRVGDDRAGRRRAFDDVRLLAAVGVVLSHSFHLAGATDPITPVIGFGNLGTLCVIAFMALSGYLVTQSWEQDPRVAIFFAKRALRILPALVVVVVVTTLIIGPLVTTESLGGYLRDPASWRYLLNNSVLHPDPTTLPGVFTKGPEVIANSSLWTLPYEVSFYLAVPLLLIAASALRRRLTMVIVLAVVVAMAVDGLADTPLVWTLRSGWLALFGVAFLCGALLRSLSGRALATAAVLACVVAAPTRGTSIWPVACTAAVATLAVAIGSMRGGLVGRGRLRADLSYGLYLWGYPVAQLIVLFTAVRRPLVLFALAAPITTVCALASWRLVESPALRLKSRLRPRPIPTLAPAPSPYPHQNAAAMIT